MYSTCIVLYKGLVILNTPTTFFITHHTCRSDSELSQFSTYLSFFFRMLVLDSIYVASIIYSIIEGTSSATPFQACTKYTAGHEKDK